MIAQRTGEALCYYLHFRLATNQELTGYSVKPLQECAEIIHDSPTGHEKSLLSLDGEK
jgi:hypothetical protein